MFFNKRYIYILLLISILIIPITASGWMLVVDNTSTGFSSSGTWNSGSSSGDKYGSNYLYAALNTSLASATAIWRPTLVMDSIYQVSIWYPQGSNRTQDAPYTIFHENGYQTSYITQTTQGGHWVLLGTFSFKSGTNGYVQLTNYSNIGIGPNVLADAVKFETYEFPKSTTGGEFRAFWIESPYLGAGFTSDAQALASINTARRYNFNAVIAEVRQYGDAYYKSSYEPIKQTYDGLSGLIVYGHDTSGGKPYIEVHAWMVANRITSSSSNAANHVMTLHPEWLSLTNSTTTSDGSYYLDPGVPDASTYNESIYLDLVRNYAVDGIHFDYIRLNSNTFGYNSIALARYNAEYGVTGQPSITDDRWDQWRRDNITNFVKRVYVNTLAINPKIKVSAATVNNGTSGSDCLSDATTSRFQEWPLWMKNHIIDCEIPMNYKSTYSWYTSIANYDYNLVASSGRHMYMGPGVYMVSTTDGASQLSYTRSHPQYKGMSLYCYTATNNGSVSNTDFFSMVSSQFFSTSTHVPAMSWKTNPTMGILKGYVLSSTSSPYPFFDGEKIYKAKVVYSGTNGSGTTYTDLVGFYAFMDVPAGTYMVQYYLPPLYTSTAGTASVGVKSGVISSYDYFDGPQGVPVELSGFEALPGEVREKQVSY
jgi:uncharacterized lipoprotein YddW (UPF0748 family)